MKVKRVLVDNRKKAFSVQIGRKVYEFPFAELSYKPGKGDPVVAVFPDPDLAHEGFTYRLLSGTEDSVLSEQVLFVARDPGYLRKHLLLELSVRAQQALKKSGLSKNALARRMKVPAAQVYRLLDHRFTGKTIDQMVKLLCSLGCEVEMQFRPAA